MTKGRRRAKARRVPTMQFNRLRVSYLAAAAIGLASLAIVPQPERPLAVDGEAPAIVSPDWLAEHRFHENVLMLDEQQVGAGRDAAQTPGRPRPHLWTDVVGDGHALLLGEAGEIEVETGIVHEHEKVGWVAPHLIEKTSDLPG